MRISDWSSDVCSSDLQLSDEGVAQLFIQNPGNRKIIGTVGELQFEVIQFRLLQEYGASCRFRAMNISKANWVSSDDPEVLNRFLYSNSSKIAYDKETRPVLDRKSTRLKSSH